MGLGAALAGVSAGALAMLPQHRRALAAAQITTLVATGSYVATALRTGDRRRIARETTAAAAGTALAHTAASVAPRTLGPLLAAHGLYDLALERIDPEVLPTPWYAPFCAAYDVTLGLALVALLAEQD